MTNLHHLHRLVADLGVGEPGVSRCTVAWMIELRHNIGSRDGLVERLRVFRPNTGFGVEDVEVPPLFRPFEARDYSELPVLVEGNRSHPGDE